MNTVTRVTSTGLRALLLVLICVFAAVPLAGCGSSGKEGGEPHGAETGEQGGEDALNKIPQSDREAFLRLATSIGTLRARAAPVAIGSADRLGPAAPILAARAQVIALHPAAALLVSVRRRLIPVLSDFAGAPLSGVAARRASRRAIAAADRIEPMLRRYSQSQPAIGGVIPD
jgi:hypothetical protein